MQHLLTIWMWLLARGRLYRIRIVSTILKPHYLSYSFVCSFGVQLISIDWPSIFSHCSTERSHLYKVTRKMETAPNGWYSLHADGDRIGSLSWFSSEGGVAIIKKTADSLEAKNHVEALACCSQSALSLSFLSREASLKVPNTGALIATRHT